MDKTHQLMTERRIIETGKFLLADQKQYSDQKINININCGKNHTKSVNTHINQIKNKADSEK